MMKRKMNKLLARLCLCLMLAYLFVPVLSVPAYAEQEKCWVLQEIFVDSYENNDYRRALLKSYEGKVDETTLTYKEYGDIRVQYTHPLLNLDVTAHVSPLPKNFRPGDTAIINVDYDLQGNTTVDVNHTLQIEANMFQIAVPNDFVPEKIYDFDYLESGAVDEIGAWSFQADDSDVWWISAGIGNASQRSVAGRDIVQEGNYLSSTIPEGQEGQVLCISIGYEFYYLGQMSIALFREDYVYVWTTPTSHEVIGEAGNGPGETGEEIDPGVINPGSNHDRPGDDGGDDIGSVVGTIAKIGGGAAAAGIGVKVIKGLVGKSGKSGGDGGKKKTKKKREEKSGDNPRDEQKKQQEEEEKKKRYEMRVYKDFGDTIYAGKTVTLSARIVEISASGAERTVPELTRQITISSSDLQVGGAFLSGQYKSAQVTAPERDGMSSYSALVTFRLVAPGGSFTQHMRFKIKQADPVVVWPDMSYATVRCSLDVIAGDNTTYRVRFFFHDVIEEPEKIVFGRYDGYEITVEPADTMYTYWAVIKNCTAPLDNKKIYGYEYWNGGMDYRNSYPYTPVSFTATFKDGLELSGSINITLYPEGLSVYAQTKDGRIPVRAYKKEDYGDFDSPYEAISLRYNCVRRTENGVEVFQPEDRDLRYGKLQGDKGEKENNVAMKYKYDATATHFEPLDTLNEPSPGATYLMKIDVVWKEKPDDVLTLPFIFKLKPKGPMEEWNKEFKKLQHLAVNFSTPETIEVNLAKVRVITPQNTSQLELRLINKAILEEYIAYWENEAASENRFAKAMGFLETVSGWLNFFGDCAFTYIIYYYSALHGHPGAAPYIDAILSPAKELLEDFGGRYTVAYIYGDAIDWDGFTKQLTDKGKSALDDVLFEMIPDEGKDFFKLKPVKLKKVGLMIACYMMVNFSMNLAKNRIDLNDSEERKKQLQMTDEEFEEATSWTNSIYAALLDTFKDMSLKFITSIIGKNIEKYLDKPNIREKLGQWVGGAFNYWWKRERNLRKRVINAKWAYNAAAIEQANTIEKALKLQKELFNTSNDIYKLWERSVVVAKWKKKALATIQTLPEEKIANIANLLCSKKWFFNRKHQVWGYSFGMLFDKFVQNGAGKVYDLTNGEMIKQYNGLEEDREALAEAEQAAAEMEAQVQAKKEANELISQLTRDIEKAETPEDIEQLLDRFQKAVELPQDEEQDDSDYTFDSDPEFKTGEDGCMYVVMKLRMNGTDKGYRFEYNMSKMFSNLMDSELGIEFVKGLFGGKLPDLPEGTMPMPGDPPLASELR